jgi:transposase InsO family protein
LIRQMCNANPLWGAPRIHGELLTLGIEVSQATVAKYMMRRRGRPSPTWPTFLRNEAVGIAAIDMFVVPSATFRLLFVMLILAHDRRKIVRFDVTQHPTAGWLSRQVTEGFPWDTAPRVLLRDRDASYGSIFRKRVEAMCITEVVTAPRSPWQNAYVERVIGSIRRECLDEVVIFNERHLRRVLSSYVELLPPHPDASFTGQRLSALATDPAAAERTNHRRSTSRRVAPSLRTPRGVTRLTDR